MPADEVDEIKEKRKQYYQKNRIEICKKTIGIYCDRSIEKIQKVYSREVKALYEKYPFEEYGDRLIKTILLQYGIREGKYECAECYEAGVMAYVYSMNRFAVIECIYIKAYIKKIINIYIKCALVICNESRNICKENGFRHIELDQIDNINKY
ncbi:hypothetical protein [Wansuia hejianensis]|uniref:Uncharacterized protein n=1 Tax=Wansuia hejianensis TaxID=2763667 RepID=A0A926EW86_9FIRM|nr:hypothetical protein [Wansuia hejianensis]MBC8589655.1 hypothetical protein [Wansuia hejianensis]